MQTNSHWLKLAGKVNIDRELHLDHGYKVRIEGAIPSSQDISNEDGTYDRVYKFIPILCEIEDEKGEVIKAKDTRSYSQKLRRRLYQCWEVHQTDLTHEEHYERVMKYILSHAYEIEEEALRQ